VIAYTILIGLLSTAAAGGPRPAGPPPAQSPSRDVLCVLEEVPLADRARQLEPLGEAGRKALITLAESSARDESLCGIAGLAALGDRRGIAPLAAALRNPALRQDVYQLARWAAFLAAGPASDLGLAMLTVIEAVSDQETWDAAGNDAIWFMGEVDHPAARDRLLIELRLPLSADTLDAVIHGLARQGEPRALETVTAMGVEALRAKSGNATPEQARRLGAVAFYQLALSPESLADGLATLGTIAVRDQEAAAAWAVHTLCARAVRRPSQRAAIEAQRQGLIEALGSRGLSWQEQKGPLGCSAATR
jgi:hypothetical protein